MNAAAGHPPFDALAPQTRLIASSFERAVGRPLLPGVHSLEDPIPLARALFEAPFVVASTDAAADPVLNYGNRAALGLWSIDWAEFTRMPGRRTAEAPEREQRERFLAEVRQKGFISNYRGIRVTADGRRFLIRDATVWNLTRKDGTYAGQAVRFDSWDWL